jgi:hypothetical protein
VGPCAFQAGEIIFLARQFHLKHRLTSVRAIGENIKDHLLPVDHRQAGFRLPIALLGRRQHLVDDDDIGAGCLGLLNHFGGLAASQEKRGGRRPQIHENAAGDGQMKVLNELLQLGEQLGSFARRQMHGLHTDEERL